MIESLVPQIGVWTGGPSWYILQSHEVNIIEEDKRLETWNTVTKMVGRDEIRGRESNIKREQKVWFNTILTVEESSVGFFHPASAV